MESKAEALGHDGVQSFSFRAFAKAEAFGLQLITRI